MLNVALKKYTSVIFYCQQTVSVIIIDMLLCCKYGNSVTIITEVTVAS